MSFLQSCGTPAATAPILAALDPLESIDCILVLMAPCLFCLPMLFLFEPFLCLLLSLAQLRRNGNSVRTSPTLGQSLIRNEVDMEQDTAEEMEDRAACSSHMAPGKLVLMGGNWPF